MFPFLTARYGRCEKMTNMTKEIGHFFSRKREPWLTSWNSLLAGGPLVLGRWRSLWLKTGLKKPLQCVQTLGRTVFCQTIRRDLSSFSLIRSQGGTMHGSKFWSSCLCSLCPCVGHVGHRQLHCSNRKRSEETTKRNEATKQWNNETYETVCIAYVVLMLSQRCVYVTTLTAQPKTQIQTQNNLSTIYILYVIIYTLYTSSARTRRGGSCLRDII